MFGSLAEAAVGEHKAGGLEPGRTGYQAPRHMGTSTREATEQFRIDEERPRSGTVVLAIHGDVDLHVAGELRERLSTAIDDASTLVVDLSGVTFIDSTTLGVLLGGMKQLRAKRGRLHVVVPRGEIRRIFEVTLLDRVFTLDTSRDEAFAAAAVARGAGP